MTGAESAEIGVHITEECQSKSTAEFKAVRSTIQAGSFRALLRQIASILAGEPETDCSIPPTKVQKDELRSTNTPCASHFKVLFGMSSHDNGEGSNLVLLRETQRQHVESLHSDIALSFWKMQEGYSGSIFFSAHLFHRETIRSMTSIFTELLHQGMEHPDTAVADLPLVRCLSPLQDRAALDIDYTGCASDLSLVDAFLQTRLACPDSIAVKDAKAELTYAELDRKSDLVSRWLIRKALVPESTVAIIMARSCQAVMAILGILKANLACLPLDIDSPLAWVSTVLSSLPDSTLVFTGDETNIPSGHGSLGRFINLSDIVQQASQDIERLSSDAVHQPSGPLSSSLACVLFVPGPTGSPKGVMLEHRGIVLQAKQAEVISHLTTGKAVANMADFGTDASLWEIFGAILNGGIVICLDKTALADSSLLCARFLSENVSVARFNPDTLGKYLSESPGMFENLNVLVVADGVLQSHTARKALLYCCTGEVYNAHGSTESSGLNTWSCVSSHDCSMGRISIGHPLTGSGAVVVDSQLRLLPPGVLGDMMVFGDGLARGFIGSGQDSEHFHFISNGDGKAVRAYLTGDRVRRRPMDGQLEFFGRSDRRLTVTGHRVELRGIEQKLLSSGAVSDAVVVASKETSTGMRLIGLVTLECDRTSSSLAAQQDMRDDSLAVKALTGVYDNVIYQGVDSIYSSRLGRDFVGWISMYDGQQISTDDMEEWLQDTIETVLDTDKPEHVLEIGTGTGMVLFNLGDRLQSYLGLEPVESAVQFVTKQIKSIPQLSGKAEVRIGSAADVGTLRDFSPTLIVVNSVVQHFPSSVYLHELLKDLLYSTTAHRLFFGDIRSLALYDEFVVSMATCRLGARVSRARLQQYRSRMREREKELILDPAFFTALKSQFPEYVHHVEILPKRMKAENELSCYRYAAVVHTKHKQSKVHSIMPDQWTNFENAGFNRRTLRQYLQRRADSTMLAFYNVPDGRTSFQRSIVDSLNTSDDPTIEYDLESSGFDHQALTIHDLITIGTSTGFKVELSCARQHSQRGRLDAVFHRVPFNPPGGRVLFDFPTDHAGRPSHSLLSHPQQVRYRRNVERHLRSMLDTQLSSGMVPSTIKVLEEMPVCEDGHIDEKMLAEIAEFMAADMHTRDDERFFA